MPLNPPQAYRKTQYTHRRGTRANQPSASDVLTGSLYYVTDETVLERSNGVSWDSYSAAVYTPPTYTQGSVLFAGVTGAPTQDNTNFFFNNTTDQLKVAGSILSPLIIGGTGVTDDLTLQSTSGVGTTGSWIFFKVGNNGAVTAMEIDHLGRIGIGTTGLLGLSSALTIRQANPPDIGYVLIVTSNLSSIVQVRTGTGVNEQAGFTFYQQTNGFEWRMAVVGNEGNAMRWTIVNLGAGTTTNVAYWGTAGNICIDSSPNFPGAGTKSIIFGDGTAPSSMASNTAGLYADDVGGTVNIFAINEAGNTTKLTGFTTGSIIFAVTATGFTENNTKFFWDNSDETLKITHGSGVLEAAVTNEKPQIHIGGDYNGVAAGVGQFYIDGYGGQGNFTMRRSNGTQASPSALADTDIIFNFRAYGYDGSAYGLGGSLRMNANGAWTGSNHGTDFLVYLTANGSTANPAERLRLSSTELRLNSAILITWGATSAFPALKRSSAVLQTRLADDSAFAQHSALEFMNNRANFLMRTAVAWNNGAAAQTGTLTNGPAAGNPTKWIPVDDNGTTRYIPAW